MTGGMRCSSSCKPDFFVLALLYEARPRLLLCESCTVEKQRTVLSSPAQVLKVKLKSKNVICGKLRLSLLSSPTRDTRRQTGIESETETSVICGKF